MRIAELTAHHVRIPLKTRVRHASYDRRINETLLIRCRLTDGSLGWGEGLPREYVTGETISSAWEHCRELDDAHFDRELTSFTDAIALFSEVSLSRGSPHRDCFGNTVRCALELAVLDAVGHSLGQPLSAVCEQLDETQDLAESRDAVNYSGVIASSRAWRVRAWAGVYRLSGFDACKLKVGQPNCDTESLVRAARSVLGRRVTLRLDANEAWTPHQAIRELDRVRPFEIASIEQPIPHHQIAELPRIRRETDIPVMLDESLCSLSDAHRAIDEGLCDIFNIRLSKCGGFIPALRIAACAARNGLQAQLGCQVGETGILSAAGRQFACIVKDLVAAEGSFDRFLVRERLTRQDLTFGIRGRAKRLPGPGLGIDVDESAVRRVTVKARSVNV